MNCVSTNEQVVVHARSFGAEAPQDEGFNGGLPSG
jgi:hypothetical protein